MDPYLEHPRYFPDFHNSFIVGLKQAIQPALPEPYYAKTEERIWIEWPERAVLPDVNVLHPVRRPSEKDGVGSVAVLEETAVEIEAVDLSNGIEVHELSLNVYAGRPGDEARLVTAIELLSPSNKSAGSEGRIAYLRKQAEMLDREVHLLEIDLLRRGEPTTLIPRHLMVRPFDYHVAARDINLPSNRLYFYPILLEKPLPRLAVPLLAGEGYVVIELQSVFDRCYDTGSYRREIDYRREVPDPPLDEARMEWARRCIERWLAEPTPSRA